MLTSIIAASPPDGASVLPDDLVDQYVKPAADQTLMLAALRATAIDWVEARADRSLSRRAWAATFDRLDNAMRLPRGPVIEVLSVSLFVSGEAPRSLLGDWLVYDDGRIAVPASASALPCGSVRVTYRAGVADAANDAPQLQMAALMLIKHLFDGGELAAPPAAVTALTDQCRVPVIG